MTLRSRLARLEKAAKPPEPRPGHAPAWFADKVLAFCRQLYRHAGLDPEAAELHPEEKTDRDVLRGLLNTGLRRFWECHGRKVTAQEFGAWWPQGGCP